MSAQADSCVFVICKTEAITHECHECGDSNFSVMSEQKALLLEKAKGPFVVGSIPIPKPTPGHILVKVKAAALNPVDWKIQTEEFIKYPAVLGSDIAGDVEELGEGVEGFSKGDKM